MKNILQWIPVPIVSLITLFAQTPEKTMTIIDTHIHLWKFPRQHGETYPPKGTSRIEWLERDCLLPDYFASDGGDQINGVVLIEASGGPSGDQLLESNQWMLDLAKREETILGVVGRLDPKSDRFEADLALLDANPHLVGLRIHNAALGKTGPLSSRLVHAMKRMSERGLTLDLLGTTPQRLAEIALQIPSDLKVVLNHFSAKDTRLSVEDEWRDGLAQLISYPNIYVKVSDWQKLSQLDVAPNGKRTTQFKGEENPERYRTIFETLLETFGPQRLVFGSNWPVSDHAGPFSKQIEILDHLLRDLPPETRDLIYRQNAIKAYGLDGFQ